MLLSSVGQGGDALRGTEFGIAASLTKPVRQSVLQKALLAALARPAGHAASAAAARDASPASANALPRVLLAEDNPINRRLVTAMLEKRGHKVVSVDNGRAAVEAVGMHQDFGIVLMDLQMPEMDGLDATATIRAGEAGTGQHLPIVALTAHAMKGDRERCLAAGMDAYLAKPIRTADLIALIDQLTGLTDGPAPVELTPAPSPLDPPFDPEDVLSRVGGDRDLLRELAEIFRTESPRLLGTIRSSLEAKDGKRLEQSAHTLRGSVGSFGAKAAAQVALQLEMAGREDDFPSAGAHLRQLEREVSRIEHGLSLLAGAQVA
jgi:CheY-like chemotaxis protein/HPt (histidine-containing phosphotransfer) domain-containing protein